MKSMQHKVIKFENNNIIKYYMHREGEEITKYNILNNMIFHNEEGPAYINLINNMEAYYLFDKWYSKKDWEKEVIYLKFDDKFKSMLND